MAKLIVGCGYLGRRVASFWLARGELVRALTRGRVEDLRSLGIEPIQGDVCEPSSLSALPLSETILYAVAPDRTRGQSPRDIWGTGLTHLTAVMRQWPVRPRLVFISSTSVYGQTGGEEVDEGAPTEPTEESGRVLLSAEQSLRSPLWPEAVVLRFAGIYGPGRLIRSQSLLRGEPIATDPSGWLNLIHVEDGAAAVIAAEARARAGGIYNVADDQPVRRRDFYGRLADLLGAPPPRFVPPVVLDGANRRISNRKMRTDLGVALRYPSYEQGLRASL